MRNTKLDTQDCRYAECRGRLSRVYIENQAAFGYANVFVQNSLRLQSLSHAYSAQTLKPFADEVSSLYGAPGGDTLFSEAVAIGMTMPEGVLGRAKLGMAYSQERMQTQGSFTLAAGTYSSTSASAGLAIAGGIRWIGIPSIGDL